MAKVALVLSGGGARGAFQFMAEKYAREVMGYKWDIIAGVSVGALNGTMIAMEKYERLEEVWRHISDDQVYTGKMNFWGLLKLVFGAKSIHGNEPLWELIQREIDPEKIRADLRVGAVSLTTGDYKSFRPHDEGFTRAILASTAIPIIWAPLDVSPEYPAMVDGGVRNISPLGDVLDAEPDEVVIINCSPQQPGPLPRPLRNALDIGKRALDIALNEIMVSDIREFIRINNMVAQTRAVGLTLRKPGPVREPYKYYRYKLIEPVEPLGDTLDFSREATRKSMRAGWERARQVFKSGRD